MGDIKIVTVRPPEDTGAAECAWESQFYTKTSGLKQLGTLGKEVPVFEGLVSNRGYSFSQESKIMVTSKFKCYKRRTRPVKCWWLVLGAWRCHHIFFQVKISSFPSHLSWEWLGIVQEELEDAARLRDFWATCLSHHDLDPAENGWHQRPATGRRPVNVFTLMLVRITLTMLLSCHLLFINTSEIQVQKQFFSCKLYKYWVCWPHIFKINPFWGHLGSLKYIHKYICVIVFNLLNRTATF